MSTEQWLIDQESQLRRAKEAYQLLYAVFIQTDYQGTLTGDRSCVIPDALDDKIQKFFGGE